MLPRLPRSSRPFVRAALSDALGIGCAVGLFLPFAGVMARRLGASELQIALLGMAPFVGFLFASAFSRLSNHLAHSQILYLLRLLAASALFGFAAVRGATAFVVLAMTVQIASALAAGSGTNLLRSHLRTIVRPSVMTAHRVLVMSVSVGMAALAGRLFDADPASYRWVFPCAGLALVILGFPMLRVPPRPTEAGEKSRPHLSEELALLREDRLFLAFLIVFFIGTLGEKLGIAITPIYFVDQLDIRYEEVGLALGIFGPLSAIVGYLVWGRVIRRVLPITVITIVMLAKAVRPFLWAAAGHMAAPLPWLVAGEIGFRFFITGLELGAILTVTSMAKPGKGPLYTGLHFMLMGVRGLLGPLLGYGLLRAGVPMPVIYVIIGLIVFAGGLALIPLRAAFVRTRRRPR